MVHHWISTDPVWQAWHLSDHVSRCGEENSGKINGCVHVISTTLKFSLLFLLPRPALHSGFPFNLSYLVVLSLNSFQSPPVNPTAVGFLASELRPCSSSLCKLPPLCPLLWLSFVPHVKDFSDLSSIGSPPLNLYDIIYVPSVYYGPSIWHWHHLTFCLSKYTMVLGEINVLSCHDNSSSGWEQRTMGEILQVLAPHKDWKHFHSIRC